MAKRHHSFADKFIVRRDVAADVYCPRGPSWSINVARRALCLIATKINNASIINLVDVSDVAIKQHCALGKVYDNGQVG
jgi:hypothetical protein